MAQAVLARDVLAQAILAVDILPQAVLAQDILAQAVLAHDVLAQAILAMFGCLLSGTKRIGLSIKDAYEFAVHIAC